jgi:hypothetical protein
MQQSKRVSVPRIYLSLDKSAIGLRWTLCGAFSTAILLLDEQARNHHEVICEHGSSHQKLEMLSTLGKAALHAATAEENGNTTLDACTELLCVLESRALLKCFLVRRLFTATLGNANQIDALRFAPLDIIPAEKPSVGTVYAWRLAEYLLVMLQRRFHVVIIRWIPVEYTVLSNEPFGAFCNEDLVPKFYRFQNLASFDEIGMCFKDGKELLFVWDLFPLKNSSARLIDNPVPEATIVIDLFAEGLDCDLGHQVGVVNPFGLFENQPCVFYYVPGGAYQFTILRHQLLMPVSGCHPLDFLHPASGAATPVSKARYAVRKQIVEVFDQSRDHSYGVPKQGVIQWVVNIGFDNGRVNAQFLAVLQAQVDSGFDYGIVDSLKCCRSKPVKSSIESIMFGNTIAIKTRESPQCIPVRDPFTQFSVIPVLDPHQGQRSYHLLCGKTVPSGLGILQTALQITSYFLDQVSVLVEKFGDRLQRRFQAYALGKEFDIGKTDLTLPRSCHFLAFAFLRFL